MQLIDQQEKKHIIQVNSPNFNDYEGLNNFLKIGVVCEIKIKEAGTFIEMEEEDLFLFN